MIELYRQELRKAKGAGVDVFVIPGPGPVSGEAFYASEDHPGDRFRVNIVGSTWSWIWLYVLYHEIAHHMLGHSLKWTSTPKYMVEYETEQLALELIAVTQPAVRDRCEREAKNRIRVMLQSRCDEELWVHTSLAIADWAGCTLKPEFRAMLEEVERASDRRWTETDIPRQAQDRLPLAGRGDGWDGPGDS